jgi:tRNA dimethylallyltransferase
VVGGTSYWIQHLIFPNRLAKPNEAPPTSDALPWDPQLQDAIRALPDDLLTLFENLPREPPSAKADPDAAFQLHSLLLLLDPPVGQRWHWKDTRKVLHSLTIIRTARRRASDIIAQQAESSTASQPRFVLSTSKGRVPNISTSADFVLCASGSSLRPLIWSLG